MTTTQRSWITLRDEWYSRLKDEGFKDIERMGHPLSQFDQGPVTVRRQDSKALFNFFYYLTHYLNDHPEIPPLEREILTPYSEGEYIRTIVRSLQAKYGKRYGYGLDKVEAVIAYYKKIVITYWQEQEGDGLQSRVFHTLYRHNASE